MARKPVRKITPGGEYNGANLSRVLRSGTFRFGRRGLFGNQTRSRDMRSSRISSGSDTVFRVLIVGMAALVGPSTLQAAALSWNNAAGGAASLNTNWNPVQVPAGADDLTFNLNNVYSVSFNNTVTASDTHTYRQGTVTLSISSPHTVGNAVTGITVGNLSGDNATMTLTTGVLNSTAAVVVGSAGGSNGVVNVDDDDADLNIGTNFTVGNNGDATLSITGTGHVVVAGQFIAGSNSASSPTVTVSGFSVAPIGISLLDVQGTGQSRIGQGGDATMTISNGGVADFAGDVIIANGSASQSTVTVEDQGLLNSRLNVDGDLLIGRNTSAGIAAGTATLFLNTGGEANVVGDTFLGDPDPGSGTGTINLNGGTFNGDAPINVLAGSTITGTGTIAADVNNSGNITPTTAAGITFNGILNNTTSNLIVGTKIHFGPTGGYNGSGTCGAEITGDAASTITPTGTLSIGKNTASGYFYLGTLAVGGHIVTLLDNNGAVLGGLTTINSGRIECPAGIGLQNGGTLKGDGLMVGDVIVSGDIDPDTPGSQGGLFTIQGDLLMNPTGDVLMTIGGSPGSSNNDRINVSGTADFGGTMRVNLKNGYVPHVGEQFIAVNAVQGRIGEFDTLVPPSPAPCNNVTFVAVYSSTAAIVLIRPPLGCTALGDLNSDGGCNGKDIQIFVNNLLNANYDACADMNGDCSDDPLDIPIFLNCLL